eukprot:NP_001254141.1 Degenerin-like protein unc-105 [Caenorhabditis elegans]
MENASSTAQLSIDIEDNGQAAQLPPQPPSRHHQWAQDQNRKNMSFEKSGHATRNASEDSKNIRFLGDHAPPSGARKRSHNKRLHDWRRRLSVNPELLRRHGKIYLLKYTPGHRNLID